MTFRWRANDDPTLNVGLVALLFFRGSTPVLLENPIFCDFSGGGSRPLPPSGSVYAHESQKVCSFAPGNHNMSHYEKIGYNIDVLQHTACLLVNPIMVDNFAFLFHCRRVYLTSYGPRREKTCLRGFRLSEFQTSLLSYSD